MKKLLLLLFCATTINTAISAATIKGTIKDSTTKEPIGYVNISIKDKNNKLITGGTSDDDGTFSVAAEKGNYIITLSFIGYKNFQKEISVKSDVVNLGVIYLEEDAQMLSEIEVVGQGMQMRLEIDKKVFSVDQNLSAAGASISDVLQNIPSVDVDGEGNVSLRNNSNVEVWINGKPAGLTEENRGQILEQMPAGSIESVELITNPSAKYNPEGTAGVINLVMKKKTTKTYYGSVSGGIQWPTASKIPGGNFGASFNYNSPKVDVYANLGVNYNHRISENNTNRYSLINAIDTISLLNSSSQSQNSRLGFFGRAGVDVHITERNTLSISGFGMYNKGNSATDINYTSYDYKTSPISILRDYSRDNNGKNTFPVYNAKLEYRHDFLKKGSFISADISVGNHGHSRTTDYIQTDFLNDTIVTGNETQKSSNNNLNIEGNIDFAYKFSDKRRLEAGWESNFSQRENSSSAINNLTEKEIDDFYNDFNYQEQIYSLYATYGDMYGNFSMQLGLRGEYMKVNTTTESKTETISNEREYWQLYPSAFFAYSFKNNHELQINYTRRVNRPRGRQINPYRDFSDSTSISFGNPDLKPQYSSSVELNYLKTWDFHSISASVYYKYTDNVIQRVSYRNNNVMENTFINISRQQSAGLELVAKNQLWKRLNLTTSINLYYEKMDSADYTSPYGETVKIKEQQDFSWNIRLMANVMITKSTTAQITANYRAPRIIAQGRQNHDYSIDIGIRQTFLKGNLSLNLTARDILDSRKFRNETWSDNFYQKSEGSWSGRTIGLVISYNFGNLKNQKKKPNGSLNQERSSEDFFMEE